MFRFKEFAIRQDRCAMKVGMDSMVLGAWAEVANARRLLDVGAGTGILALMTAQRSQALITGIELDAAAARQAADNAAASPWAERVRILCADACHWQPDTQYDTIVCNPPYFQKSYLPAGQSRALARHAGELSPERLVARFGVWLLPGGSWQIVIPADLAADWQRAAADQGWHVARRLALQPHPAKPVHRYCLSFSRLPSVVRCESLCIRQSPGGVYSEAYRQLTHAYHTHF